MSSSTALLPKKKKDHPIFMRICHSSWSGISQKSLVSLRTFTATYLVSSFVAIIKYDLKYNELGWETIFQFSSIAYFMQMIFGVLAAMWAFMHLHYPHHASQEPSWTTRLQKLLSPPRQNPETSNRDWFSVFYAATHAFTFMTVFIYWVVLNPQGETIIPGDKVFGHGHYREFYVVSKYGFNLLLAVVEILFLNSHVRSLPVSSHIGRISWHVAGLATLSSAYIGWAYLGHHYTDKYSYYFLDHEKLGWDYTSTSIVLFTLLSEFALLGGWVLTAFKEKLTSKDQKNSGYLQLPQ